MKPYAPELLRQIARFGALSRREIATLCRGKAGQTSLYECLVQLSKSGLTRRISHPTRAVIAYQVTEKGFETVIGRGYTPARAVREADLVHTIRVSETLIGLACYKNITGFATEFEMSREECKQFSGSKIPDGVIQITRDGMSYELAVEVEVHRKAPERVQEFIQKYQDAFSRRLQCSGVIIVCDESGILESFRDKLKKSDDTVAKRFLVIPGPGTPELNPKLYGEFQGHPGSTPNLGRTIIGGVAQYLPIKSAWALAPAAQNPPYLGGQSQNQPTEEESKPISLSRT